MCEYINANVEIASKPKTDTRKNRRDDGGGLAHVFAEGFGLTRVRCTIRSFEHSIPMFGSISSVSLV